MASKICYKIKMSTEPNTYNLYWLINDFESLDFNNFRIISVYLNEINKSLEMRLESEDIVNSDLTNFHYLQYARFLLKRSMQLEKSIHSFLNKIDFINFHQLSDFLKQFQNELSLFLNVDKIETIINSNGINDIKSANEIILNLQRYIDYEVLNDIPELYIIEKYNSYQRRQMKEKLAKINPYDFEIVIKELLKKMGYINIEVTKKSHDLGVDLIAELDNHIIKFSVAIQVKRQQSNIQAPSIDQLQGVLHRHNANRGIFITTGGFSKGAREAAISKKSSEIVLIDGEMLLNLLFEHQIGIISESIMLHSVDDSFFQNLMPIKS